MPAFRLSSPPTTNRRRRSRWRAAKDVVLGIVLCIALLAGGGWVLWTTLGGEPVSVARPGSTIGGGESDDAGNVALGPMPVTVPIIGRPAPAAAGTPGVAAVPAGPAASVPVPSPGLMPAAVPAATPSPAASAFSSATADATAGAALAPAPPRLAVVPPPVQPMAVPADTTFAGRSFQYGDANDPMVVAMHPSAKYRSDGTAYDRSIGGDPSLVRENLRLENARRFVMSMCRDQQGRLWVGCENEQPGDGTGGVQCFDPSAPPLHQWTQYTIKDGLGDDNGYAIACDKQDRIWVGHLNHGVSVFNHNSKGHWQCYEVVAGLSRPDTLSGPIGERVFAIKCCPTDGDVWMATNCGLARYSDSKQTWTYLTRADGLPSDQANALAFDNAGNLYVGTQCDGIAMADAADNYRTWRTAAGPDEEPTTPTGEGLPTNLINDVLVANDGTVYAATTTGLAWSKDRGHHWKYIRGKDYADKVRGRYGGPPQGWASSFDAAKLLTEDYCTALAWDNVRSALVVGHRATGYQVISLARHNSLLSDPSSQYQEDYIRAFVPGTIAGVPIFGTYGSGAGALGRSSPRDSAVAAGVRMGPDIALPAGAAPPTAAQLGAMDVLADASSSAAVTTTEGANLGEDWATQGDWVGRYGRQHNILCGAMSPFDQQLIWDNIHHIAGHMGPHHDAGDSLRAWIHWIKTDNPKTLYDPVEGVRRQSEWDDHGEAYPTTFEGPDIWVEVKVPAGVQRVSLYFMNKDGHTAANRWRDYRLTLFNGRVDPNAVQQNAGLTHARVRDFWGGVYKQFVVQGPGSYWVRIARNGSTNTIVSALFIDRLAGSSTPTDSIPFAWLGGVRYEPPAIQAVPGGGVGYEALKAWLALDRGYEVQQAWQSQIVGRRLAFRALWHRANAPPALVDNWRWAMSFWTPADRREFNRAMDAGWVAAIRMCPQMVWEARRPMAQEAF